jgi:hypothetical protein
MTLRLLVSLHLGYVAAFGFARRLFERGAIVNRARC